MDGAHSAFAKEIKRTVVSDSVSVDRPRLLLAAHRRGHRGFRSGTSVQDATTILVLGKLFLDCLSGQPEKTANGRLVRPRMRRP